MFLIHFAVLAGYLAVEEVSAVNLNARFVCEDLKFNSCFGTYYACSHFGIVAFAVLVSVKHPVEVETIGKLR